MMIMTNRRSITIVQNGVKRRVSIGDRVRLPRVPPSWLPVKWHTVDGVRLLERCVGRVYTIDGFDEYDQIEIGVFPNGRPTPPDIYSNRFWIEPEYLEFL